MLEVKGKFNTAKVFIDNIEKEAIEQLTELCDQPFVEGYFKKREYKNSNDIEM